MSFLYATRSFSDQDKRDAIAKVFDNTIPDRDFYLLVIGAVLLAIAGIFADSIPVLIAAMIIAPLAYPILGISLGVAIGDLRLASRCIVMLLISLLIAIIGAEVLTASFGQIRVDPVFISFESNLYMATVIAIIAGFIAAYGLVRSKVGGAMTGVGIAVSLMPPLVATGIGLVDVNSFPPSATFLIFLLNVGGIFLGSVVVFCAMRIGRHHQKK